MCRSLLFLAVIICTALYGAEKTAEPGIPKQIGSRTVVLDFTVNEQAAPLASTIVSSETPGLNAWAKALVASGQLKITSPGVSKIGEGKYRASISFPVEGDGAPLPPNVSLPQARVQMPPQYPYELARDGISGGVLLKLTINEAAKLQNVELVRTSHAGFGPPALKAVQKWQFSQPAKRDNQPIAVTLFQLITFEAEGKPIAPWQWQVCPEPSLPKFSVTGSYIPVSR